MTESDRRAAIQQELKRGRSALASARALRDLGHHNDGLNRLYYALFHHVLALLLIEGVEPKRHSALARLLGQHVVGHHVLTAADVAVVSRTAAYRDLADYERTWEADAGVSKAAFDEVEPVIARITTYLTDAGWV